ncbi:hypothetical protein SERLADRAFT_458211 [Serpula lacrymans var. lacrymans S7.9]|uniref:Uncharacterized protein n=1 Tax=Serpula lacrymans var. lacrymans (strain S7.9) TaxID=578457 RepID=F8NH14_SERL9|nr:uncharacterized protein SERLADRAFT_458211 [Serpula lacrymans var. lacrymans S7.9]EGO29871.1 hypothetical protein SERLADRAFT_458211 [Serpula lacrymans var. lacrymans S7.9]
MGDLRLGAGDGNSVGLSNVPNARILWSITICRDNREPTFGVFFQRSESWSVPIRGDSDAWASMATLRLLFVVSAAQTPSLPFLQYLDLVDGLPPTRPMGLYQAIPGCLFQSRFLVRSRID